MEKLSTIVKQTSDMIPCPSCDKHAFYDWGIKLLLTEKKVGKTGRWDNLAESPNVLVCAGCHTPIVQVEGKFYDASEFVTQEEIASIIEQGTSDRLALPPRRMDP